MNLLGRLVSRIPSGGGFGLGHGSMVTSRTTLIHLTEERMGLETGFSLAVDRFFD